MPAPTNISALTATDLGTLPASVTQTVDDSGTTYDVWYRYTATATDTVISVFGYGDASVYMPKTTVWTGPASAPVSYLNISGLENNAVYFPVTSGETYYLKFKTNSGNPTPAVLTLTASSAANGTIAAGMIAVNDDTEGFPMAIIDNAETDATTVRYFPDIATGESVALLDDGTTALIDNVTGDVRIYDAAFNLLASCATASTASKLASNRTDTFWTTDNDGVNWFVKSFGADGVVIDTTSAIGTVANTPEAIGVNAAGTILYYFKNVGVSCTIKRWNLSTDMAMSDFATLGACLRDIVILSDGTVVVADAINDELVHLDTSGSEVLAWAANSNLGDRITCGLDSTSVWLWNKISVGDGQETFTEFQVSDGATLIEIDGFLYANGSSLSSNFTQPATDSQLFGNSESCPFWILPAVAGGSTGTIRVVKVTIPSNDPAEFDFTATGGLTPASFSLANGDQQIFNSVAVGSGYGVSETADAGYVTTYDVSNDSPIDNIAVAEDETVTVTVTNTAIGAQTFSVAPIKRRWLRRSPIYSQENKRVVYHRFWLDIQAGQGNRIDLGMDPKVYFRVSGDWGSTWSSTRVQSAGLRGQFGKQVVFWRCGQHRNAVFEVYGSDPCPVYINDAFVELEPGTD